MKKLKKWLDELPLRIKLTFVFGVFNVLIFSIALLSYIGIKRMSAYESDIQDVQIKVIELINKTQYQRIVCAVTMQDIYFASDVNQKILRDDLTIKLKRFDDNWQASKNLLFRQDDIKNDTVSVSYLVESIDKNIAIWRENVIKAANHDDDFLAYRQIEQNIGIELSAAFEDLVKTQEDVLIEIDKNSHKLLDDFQSYLIAISIIALVANLLMAKLFSRYLIKEIGGELSEIKLHLERMAYGDFSICFYLKKGDESSIMYHVKTVQTKLYDFLIEQKKVLTFHRDGYISYTLPISKFTHIYKDMALELSALINLHVTFITDIVDCLERYVDGDFSKNINVNSNQNDLARLVRRIDKMKKTLKERAQNDLNKIMDKSDERL